MLWRESSEEANVQFWGFCKDCFQTSQKARTEQRATSSKLRAGDERMLDAMVFTAFILTGRTHHKATSQLIILEDLVKILIAGQLKFGAG